MRSPERGSARWVEGGCEAVAGKRTNGRDATSPSEAETARIATEVRRSRACGLSSVSARLGSSLGCRWSAYTPLAAALRRDEVVKSFDLRVE